ncbi:MAG TPA: hypothetical protein VF148_00875 [Acidimicrobiia bacterium]
MAEENSEEDTRRRNPIRSLLRLAVLAGVVFSAGRFVTRKKEEYAGLTESQARDRLMEKMTPRVGDDTAGDIADRVIPKLKERGLIKPDPIEEAADEVEKAADEVADAAEEKVAEAADKVAEAVNSVVKDSAKD